MRESPIFNGLAPGTTVVRVHLLRGTTTVVTRTVELQLLEDRAISIVLSSRCDGTTCSIDTECASGACVEQTCGGDDPTGCGPLACMGDSDCTNIPNCATPQCVGFECICASDFRAPGDAGIPDSGLPDTGTDGGTDTSVPTDSGTDDSGPIDTGTPDTGAPDTGTPDTGTPDTGPPPECTAGATDTQMRDCGACNEGSQTRSRTCQSDRTWGAFSSWTTCNTTAQCAPAATETRTVACGNCGSQLQRRTCSSTTCRWGSYANEGSCTGQGPCAPGATRAGCDTCGHEVCSASCAWGGCTPRPGNACLYEGGSSFQCCTPAGGGSGWQFCSSSTCQYFPCASHSCS